MKLEVSSYSQLSTAEKNKIDKHIFDELEQVISIGDFLVENSYGRIRKIVDIYYQEDMVWANSNPNDRTKVPKTFLYVKYQEVINWEGDLKDPRSEKADDFLKGYHTGIWTGSLEDLKAKAEELITKKENDEEDEEEEQSQGLATLDSEGFKSKKHSLITAKNELNSIANTASYLMEQKVRALWAMVDKMKKEVKKLSTIIWTLELYMGLKEDIRLIQEGTPASDDEPIKLLQERLYMDEEVGDPTNGGLDFKNIDTFLEWLLETSDYFKHPNYELLVPHQKCVRIMRVRRESKNYSENPWVNHIMNLGNFETFILIRNGTNLYYITTDMRFSDKLFPGQSELMDVYERLKESRSEETATEEVGDIIEMYKRNLVIMQGLVDRTEVFGDLYGKVNFLNGTSINKGDVELIYDCDKSNQISDGDTLFSDWLTESNKATTKGSRVLVLPGGGGGYGSGYRPSSRFYKMYTSWTLSFDRDKADYPSYPEAGIYQLLEEPEEGEYHSKGQLYFMYIPEARYGEQRRNKVSFGVFPQDRGGDSIMVNYDLLRNDQLDWLWKMMHDRRLRKNYATNMKFLINLYNYKKHEIKEERPFVELLISASGKSEKEIDDAIHWWKTKNKYKRSLKEDDKKAYGMILAKLTGKTVKLTKTPIEKLELSDTQMEAMENAPLTEKYDYYLESYHWTSVTTERTFTNVTTNSLKKRGLLEYIGGSRMSRLGLTEKAKKLGFKEKKLA